MIRTIERYGYLGLFLMATLPFLTLLRGEFFYDDQEFIENNPRLLELKNVKDLFLWKHQPTKPVSNFFLSLAYLVGGGSVSGQRLFSLLFHLLNCFAFYLLLRNLAYLLRPNIPRAIPFWTAVGFAIHPIHTETLAVAQFRGEVIGSFFCFLALLCAFHFFKEQKQIWKKGLWAFQYILFWGLATFSKEVFLPTVFLLSLCIGEIFFPLPRKYHWKFLALAIVSAGLWSFLLWKATRLDKLAYYTYLGTVGPGILPIREQIVLASRAILEAGYKLLIGFPLTTLRLADRPGIGAHWHWSLHLVLLISFFSTLLWFRKKTSWSQFWAFSFYLSMGLAIAIPNLNLGSEHYLYFPAATFLASASFLIWEWVLAKFPYPGETFGFCFMGITLGFSAVLEHHLYLVRENTRYYESQAELFPKAVGAWTQLAQLQLDQRTPASFQEAKQSLENAKSINPKHREVLTTEFDLYYNTQDLEGLESTLKKLRDYAWYPNQISKFYYHFAVLSLLKKDCARAEHGLNRALYFAPLDPKIQKTAALFKKESKNFCKR